MSPFWDKIRAVTPWVTPVTHPTKRYGSSGQLRLLPDTYQFHNVDACIMCGACVAACTSHEVSREFLGPAALAKAERFVADPREPAGAKQARLTALQESHGMWDCTRCNMCVQVCPKDVQPMEAIVRLRRSALQHGLTETEGARHITGFVDLVRHEGRLNEALMPLKVLGMDLRRLISVLPLGIRMWLKGKVPSPFGQTIPGIEQVRAIFAAARRRTRRA
jgi:succinate dehydrogenase / fumarate reductase iron-sulfur subunit